MKPSAVTTPLTLRVCHDGARLSGPLVSSVAPQFRKLSEPGMIDHKIVYTRDEKIPLADNDRGMMNGWKMVPIPPTADGDWVAVDTRSDKRTGWARASALMLVEPSRRH
jgi:hypothetical protein